MQVFIVTNLRSRLLFKKQILRINLKTIISSSDSLKYIYPKGWVILARSFVLKDECILSELLRVADEG